MYVVFITISIMIIFNSQTFSALNSLEKGTKSLSSVQPPSIFANSNYTPSIRGILPRMNEVTGLAVNFTVTDTNTSLEDNADIFISTLGFNSTKSNTESKKIPITMMKKVLDFRKSDATPEFPLEKANKNHNDTMVTSELKQGENLKLICGSRAHICDSKAHPKVCAMKVKNGIEDFRDFENSCYLYLANMCDYPNDAYYIVTAGTCSNHLLTRRTNVETVADTNTSLHDSDYYTDDNSTETHDNVTKTALRDASRKKESKVSLPCRHKCPLSCTDAYLPVCINVNSKLKFKFYTFQSHCKMDLYMCTQWELEFADRKFHGTSNLDYTRCAANEFIRFARFSEVASSMSHYGWLEGDQRFSAILPINDRIALTGKQRYRPRDHVRVKGK
ncbi:hypothetical protein JYU34_000167 [Plutella xylostella]|uniref:Uncharacterized protein n=2 Tax=Plutella xylostella TaxID=51655 RepID=A0ABQ7R713_PLUXY|nr:hypothetical protein JYU34_000167 [Plutella xylostella]